MFFPLILGVVLFSSVAHAQEWCVPADPDYCVTRICGEGQGDCDPGQCAPGLTCVDDVGAQYGLPAYYDVCERADEGEGPDPDYCVNHYCGIGDGDCDPGQCDEGVCVNDVGAEYGLPAHYDVCEARDDPPDVSRFDGSWNVLLRYTSRGCTQHADERSTVTITNGSVRASGITLGTVAASGAASGFLYHTDGSRIGEWEGRLQERSGRGTWFNYVGCGGVWTITKR